MSANSSFTGDTLLSAADAGDNSNAALVAKLGLRTLEADQRVLEAAE